MTTRKPLKSNKTAKTFLGKARHWNHSYLEKLGVALIGNRHGFWPLSGAYDERAAGGFHDLVGDNGQFIDLHDSFHLRAGAGGENYCQSVASIARITVVEIDAERPPVACASVKSGDRE